MLWNPTYERDGIDVIQAYSLTTGNVIRYRAHDIKKEPTGTHAHVTIAVNHVSLAWSRFNTDRDEDRVRLANSAYTAWGNQELDQTEWPKTSMKKGLDNFCEGLWTQAVQANKGELLEGDPDLPPATLLLGSYIVEGGGSIIFAPPGRGKSYTALLQAVALDAGSETLWPLPHGPRHTGYINLERSRTSIQRRLARVNRALGLDPRRPLPFINRRGHTLRDVLEAASETFQEHECEVIFLDSISRGGYGDLQADRGVNAAMDDLNAHFETWVALGHTPRQDESHVFGSIMFEAAADLIVRLTSQGNKDDTVTGIGLETIKANDTPRGGLSVHVLEWSASGLEAVRKARPGEFPEIDAGKAQGLSDEVREYLLMVGAASATDIAKELGRNRSNIVTLLRQGDTFMIKERQGKSILYSVRSERKD